MRDFPRDENDPIESEAAATVPVAATFRARLGLWTLLALSVFAWAPMLHAGYLHTANGFLPAFNLTRGDALASVATTPDVWRGTGIAAFVPAQPLLLLGMTPAAAVEVVLITSLLLGALGIYVWLQPQLGDRAAGLGGLVYLYLPLGLLTIYAHGSISGALILALLPMILGGLANYRMQQSMVGAAVAALAILWLWRTQAGVAAAASIMFLLYVVTVERHWGALLLVGVSALAGALSLLPIWGIVDPAASAFTTQLGTLYDLLRAAPAADGAGAAGAVQIGVVSLLFAVMAGWGLWLQENPLYADVRRLLGFCLAGALLMLGLTLTWSAPLWSLSGLERFFGAPWQVALLAAPLLAASAGALLVVFPALQRHAYWSVLALLVILSAQPWLTPRFTTIEPPVAPLATVGNNHVAILEAHVREDRAANQAQLQVTWQVVQPLAFDYSIFVQAVGAGGEGAGGEGAIRIAQFDGAPLADAPATTWQPGDLFAATYTLDLPADTPVDAYEYGWYDWRDGTRLPINMGLNDKLVFYAR